MVARWPRRRSRHPLPLLGFDGRSDWILCQVTSNPYRDLSVARLRDQITAPARTILLVLFAVAAVVFVIACSNVANLILARTVRREGELAVRAALGASRSASRRTLPAESLVLCSAGALFGLALARPLVSIVARYAARFSMRALEEGAAIAAIGIAAGALGGYAAAYWKEVHLPGAWPMRAAAAVLAITAIVASLMPAARAACVDVLSALRSE